MPDSLPHANLDHTNFTSKKQDTLDEVWRLLHYAVSDANVDLAKEKPELIKAIVPVLQKAPEALTENDVTELLQAYNELSQLVYPATNESLRLKEKIEEYERDVILGTSGPYSAIIKKVKNSYTNFWVALWVVIVIFIVYQSYIYFISDTLEKVTEQLSHMKMIEEKINTAKAASNEPDKSSNKLETVYPFKDLYEERRVIWLKLNTSYCVLRGVSMVWTRWYPNEGILCDSDESAKDKANDNFVLNSLLSQCQHKVSPDKEICEQEVHEIHEKSVRENFFAGALAVLRVSNYLVLPTMLGLLGALAFVIRGILDSFSKSSFILGARRRWGMRVALGPLLGLISGIVIAPDIQDFKELSFSPLVWGFLMGYSVEFAFSLFDFLIQKGRSAIGASNIKSEEKNKADAKPVIPQVKAVRPARSSATSGTEALTSGERLIDGAVVELGTSQTQAATEQANPQESTPDEQLPASDGGGQSCG